MDDQTVETTLYSLAKSPPRCPDRRSSERHLSLLRVGALSIDGRRELCLIRNISAGGMLIRAYTDIPPGARLSIELKHGEQVAGAVQWAENGLTGVAFDRPIDIFALLAPSDKVPSPRMPRIEVSCTAWVRAGADIHRTRALNISQGGLCIETPAELEAGEAVVVTLLGLSPMPSVVRWRGSGVYGIGFNRVMALSELVAWLKNQEAERQRAAG